MRIRLDIIAHTFRNKYLKYNGGVSSHSSGNTTFTGNSTNDWFYEDEKGNLHSRLDLIIDKIINGNLTIKGELTADTINIPAIATLMEEIKTLKQKVATLELKNSLSSIP